MPDIRGLVVLCTSYVAFEGEQHLHVGSTAAQSRKLFCLKRAISVSASALVLRLLAVPLLHTALSRKASVGIAVECATTVDLASLQRTLVNGKSVFCLLSFVCSSFDFRFYLLTFGLLGARSTVCRVRVLGVVRGEDCTRQQQHHERKRRRGGDQGDPMQRTYVPSPLVFGAARSVFDAAIHRRPSHKKEPHKRLSLNIAGK